MSGAKQAFALPPDGIYVRTTPKGPRYWTIERVGATVETATGSDPAKLKARSRTFASEDEAARHVTKTRLAKLREGFLFLRDRESAKPGEVVVRVALPHAQMHDFLDVHPRRPWLLIGSEQRPMNREAWLHLVELDTGAIREVFHTRAEGEWTKHVQTFSHCARFTEGGEAAVTAINGVTLRVELASGAVTQLARYQEDSYDAHFNSHCVWPSRDAACERILIFDRGDVIRVLGPAGAVVFETSLASPTSECRAGALSASGRRVAAYVVNRAVLYAGADAAGDATHEVRVWDVDSGELVGCIPMRSGTRGVSFFTTIEAREIGFTWDDRTVIWRTHGRGPVFMDVASGEQVRVFGDPDDPLSWPACSAWASSPDGSRIAMNDGDRVRFLEVATGVFDAFELSASRADIGGCRRLVYSGHGKLLFCGGGTGEIVGWKLA